MPIFPSGAEKTALVDADKIPIADSESGDAFGFTSVSSMKTAVGATFATTSNVTSNSPGDTTVDDFVFGSPQLDDDGNTGHDSRMFFDKGVSAFRVGTAESTQWDNVNLGIYSAAFGRNCTSSGVGSFAAGTSSSATNGNSVALGTGCVASGAAAFAMGVGSTASGSYGAAIGDSCLAGAYAFAQGRDCTSSQNYTVSMGYDCSSSQEYAVAMGDRCLAQGTASFAMGRKLRAHDFMETVFGQYNIYSTGSTTTWNAGESLFVIGNGAHDGDLKNALQMLKNGKLYLDDPKTPTAHPANYKPAFINTDTGLFYTQDMLFTGLSQTPSSFTTANALYKVNAAGDGLDESVFLVDQFGSGSLSVASGDMTIACPGQLQVASTTNDVGVIGAVNVNLLADGGDLNLVGKEMVILEAVNSDIAMLNNSFGVNRNATSDTSATLPNAGMNIYSTNTLVGYLKVHNADTDKFTFKAPTGNELTLDINSDSTITVAGALNIEADSVINQDVTTDADVVFNSVAGGIAASENLDIHSTTDPTKGNINLNDNTVLKDLLTFEYATEPAAVADKAQGYLGNSGGNSASTTIILDHNDNTGTPQTWINDGLLGITMGVELVAGPINAPNQVSTENKFGAGSTYYNGINSESIQVTGLPTTSDTDWTFQGWIWLPAGIASGETHIFSAGDSTGDNYMDFFIKQNAFLFNLRQAGGWAVQLESAITNIEEQQWIHIAMTRSGDDFYMHINGVMQVTDTWAGTIVGLDNYYAGWGGAANKDIYYTGYIDEFKYDAAALYGPAPFTPQGTAFDVKIPAFVLENGDVVYVGGGSGSSSGIIVHDTLEGIDGTGTHHVGDATPVDDTITANAVTIDLTGNLNHHLDLEGTTAATAITLTNGDPGVIYTIRITQGTGGYSVTWGNGAETVSFAGGTAPTITATNDQIDIVRLYCSQLDTYEEISITQNI